MENDNFCLEKYMEDSRQYYPKDSNVCYTGYDCYPQERPCNQCKCGKKCELVYNGGFGYLDDGLPKGWGTNNTDKITSTNVTTEVHSGDRAVLIDEGGMLTQTIRGVSPGCCYVFSFFAKAYGEEQNDPAGFVASVYFITKRGFVLGAESFINSGSISYGQYRPFSYYRDITIKAPCDTVFALIILETTDGQVIFDNVSLNVQSQ